MYICQKSLVDTRKFELYKLISAKNQNKYKINKLFGTPGHTIKHFHF